MRISKGIFVDTSAWVALADRSDARHTQATSVYPSLLKSHARLITSNLVVAETYIILRKDLGHEPAMQLLERIKSSPRIRRVFSDEDVESEAEKILLKYGDQDFSYTDAVSFSIMKKQDVQEAFCFDRHFATAGFRTVP